MKSKYFREWVCDDCGAEEKNEFLPHTWDVIELERSSVLFNGAIELHLCSKCRLTGTPLRRFLINKLRDLFNKKDHQ